MSAGPLYAFQVGSVAAMLAAPSITGLVAPTPDGPAVFASAQTYADKFRRITVQPPQVQNLPVSCGRRFDITVTVHVWAHGAASSLEAAALADALIPVLDAPLAIPGFSISTHQFVSATPVGDEDPSIEHIVMVFLYRAAPRPTA